MQKKKRPKNLLCNGQVLAWFICKPQKYKEGVVKKKNWEFVKNPQFFAENTAFSPCSFEKKVF